MKSIDVFNGDADGICALIQLRLAYPQQNQLVTGVKRDIGLLKQVSAGPGDRVSVLDISLDKNRLALLALLENQVEILYVDHHFAGEIPNHSGLTCLIDTAANCCTSLLINDFLQQRFPAWAVTGAFGDNLNHSAYQAAKPLQLSATQLAQLQQLGICINYNAYGAALEDLHIPPEQLYRQLAAYPSPFDFIAEQAMLFEQLQAAYADDMRLANTLTADLQNDRIAVFILPDEKWARRVNGVWANELVNQYPDRAHALIHANQQGGFQVSVRAPLTNKTGADELCRQFADGGGRQAAAGINHLDKQQLEGFIAAFQLRYGSG